MTATVPVLDFSNVNSLWAGVIVETLVRLGLRHAVISPGSRSAPLVFALTRHPGIGSIPVLDERSAAFLALGLAKEDLRPTALVCTSGTAAANFFPAVIEARETGVPLLVLSADRPPEMRDCRSGQTIDQRRLYGDYPLWQTELAVPESGGNLLAYLRQTLIHAFERSLHPRPGPVHLNIPFRDPLAPLADEVTGKLAESFPMHAFFSAVRPPVLPEAGLDPADGAAAIREMGAIERGMIVAGPAQPRDPAAYCAAAARLAGALGWPVLADGLSPLRNFRHLQTDLVSVYDWILGSEPWAGALRPDAVLLLDDFPTSKRLRSWLESCDAPLFVATASERNRDALHRAAVHIRCAPEKLAEAARGFPVRDRSGYARLWSEAEARAVVARDARVKATAGLFEGRIAWELAEMLPQNASVFVANSTPVRDMEFFWRTNERAARIFFNRGANGIDGTLSTALGLAHERAPACLLTGDLAFLHDTNGLLSCGKIRGSLTVLLINNRGGGIFEFLPVARYDPPFEEFFATPQQVDLAGLCAAHGVPHRLIGGWEELREAMKQLSAAGVRVLEIRTDRKNDAALRRALFREVAAALGEPPPPESLSET